MKKYTFFLFILSILLSTLFSGLNQATATEPGEQALFTETDSNLSEKQPQSPTVMRWRYASLNWAALDRLAETRTLLVNFFPDAAFTFVLDRVENANESTTYVGGMRELAQSTVVLTVFGSCVQLNLYAPDAVYSARCGEDDLYLVSQIDPSAIPQDAPAIQPEVPPVETELLPEAEDDSPFIDVLVVYTPAARIAAGGTTAIQGLISQDFATTNVAYANSLVTQRLRLVGTAEISYVESGDMRTDLYRLQDKNDGYMDSVHPLRDSLYADLVSLYVTDPSDNACGMAFVMGDVGAYFEAWAFSIIHEDCAGFLTFAHELGHNMGGNHDWYVSDTLKPYTYAHGFVEPLGHFRTIMSYGDLCYDLKVSCTRLPYFSNPAVFYDGRPMGIPPNTDASCKVDDIDHYRCDAHVALTFSKTLPVVANFRDNPLNEPVVVEHCGTVDGETWSDGAVHLVTCDATVSPEAKLSIGPGAIIKFNPRTRLIVNGYLSAIGTQDMPITFTSYRDDSIGGDTDGSGLSSAAADDWGWIEFTPDSDYPSTIDHAVIRYGGTITGLTSLGNVVVNQALTRVQNSIISHSGQDGIYLQSYANAFITGNEISNNEGACISMDPFTPLTLSGNTCTANSTNGVWIRGGTIGGVVDWDQTNLVYRLAGEVRVGTGASLTIKPGMIIKADRNQRLVVEGRLMVSGEALRPVYFSSYRDDTIGGNTDGGAFTTALPGDWGWIEFTPGSDDASTINQAVIRYGGSVSGFGSRGNLFIQDASPMIQNSRLTHSGQDGVYIQSSTQGNAHPTLSENTFTNNQAACLNIDTTSLLSLSGNLCFNNGTNGVGVRGGVVNGQVLWDQADLPYRFMGDITIQNGSGLTIGPGMIYKFNLYQRLIVQGRLTVNGTASQPVYFTSYRDDSVGGDTEGWGVSTGFPGEWGWIEFTPESDDASLISHAQISYGGMASSTLANLVIIDASPSIEYSRIISSTRFGIDTNEATPTLTCNDIFGNNSYGIYNEGSYEQPSVLVVAEKHWWGSASGPYHYSLNEDGTGDAVSDGVDFEPWLEAPCQSLLPPPMNLRAVTIDQSHIQLTWQDISDETAFHLERSPDGNHAWEEIVILAANSASYIDGSLNRETSYYYRLRAFRESDEQFSAYSNTAYAQTNSAVWLWLPVVMR